MKTKDSLSLCLMGRAGIMVDGDVSSRSFVWGICCKEKTISIKEPKQTYILCYNLARKWIGYAIVRYTSMDRSMVLINTNEKDVNQALDEMEETTPSAMNKQIQEMMMEHNNYRTEEDDRNEEPERKRYESLYEPGQSSSVPSPSSEPGESVAQSNTLYLIRDGNLIPYAFHLEDGTIKVIESGNIYIQSTQSVVSYAEDDSSQQPTDTLNIQMVDTETEQPYLDAVYQFEKPTVKIGCEVLSNTDTPDLELNEQRVPVDDGFDSTDMKNGGSFLEEVY